MPKLPIGMNLAGINDWDPGFPFKNLMWGARQWMSQNEVDGGPWDTEQAKFFEYDDDGYPLEVPFVTPGAKGIPQHVFTVLPNRLSAGKYILLYEGEGAFEAILGSRIIERSPGRVILQMTHASKTPEVIKITRSKRGNHVRNIRISAEKFDPASLDENPFLPEFLEFCRPFHALRFMDWGATNNSLEGEWISRRRPSFYTMVGGSGDPDGLWGAKPNAFQLKFAGGVAHEIIIKLANTLKVDPWICIPHRATDDYVRRCSALYREKLDPERKLYVEYSNEVWNWQFNQADWMLSSEYAARELKTRRIDAWEMKDGKRKGTMHPERMGVLFSRAFQLWLSQWPNADRKRVTTVCAVQAAWADASIRTIDWCAHEGGVDAVSAAAYFGPGDEQFSEWERRGASLSAADVIQSMKKVLEAQSKKEFGASQIAIHTKALGLRFLNYEGGQHIVPKGQQETSYSPALKAVQSDPEMYKLYIEGIRQQKRLGSTLFCAFNSVGDQGERWGSWGVKEKYSSPDSMSPKYRALIDSNTPLPS